jgi:hypothetical protein
MQIYIRREQYFRAPYFDTINGAFDTLELFDDVENVSTGRYL